MRGEKPYNRLLSKCNTGGSLTGKHPRAAADFHQTLREDRGCPYNFALP